MLCHELMERSGPKASYVYDPGVDKLEHGALRCVGVTYNEMGVKRTKTSISRWKYTLLSSSLGHPDSELKVPEALVLVINGSACESSERELFRAYICGGVNRWRGDGQESVSGQPHGFGGTQTWTTGEPTYSAQGGLVLWSVWGGVSSKRVFFRRNVSVVGEWIQ